MQVRKEIFISYAHKDKRLLDELVKHLSGLHLQGFISSWYNRRLNAGMDWANEIDKHLNTSQIILLLVSPDFMASHYCSSVEMKRAMERHTTGEACVIPIILRPTDWTGAPFGDLQFLPSEAKPITRWSDQDQALLDVVQGIRKVIDALNFNVHGTVETPRDVWPEIPSALFKKGKELPSFIHKATLKARLREKAHLETLLQIFSSIDVTLIDLHKIYRASIPDDPLHSYGYEYATTLIQMITKLLEGPVVEGDIPSILKFSERCALQLAPHLNRLRGWGDTAAQDLGIHPRLLAELRRKLQDEANHPFDPFPSLPLYLLIILRTSEEAPSAFTVKAWLRYGQEEADPLDAQEEGKLYTAESMPDLLDEMLTEISTKSTISEKAKDELKIEFFLPRDLISLPVEHWTFSERTVDLGAKYQVVVRSLDRILIKKIYELSRASWRTKWDIACTLPYGMNAQHVHWINDASTYDGEIVYHMLEAPHKKVLCLCLALIPPEVVDYSDKKEVFRMMCKAGTPIALWPKHLPAAPANTKKFRKSLENLLGNHRLAELPAVLLKQRWEAALKKDDEHHLGRSLTLLWDDPNRLPPDGKLLQIEQRR